MNHPLQVIEEFPSFNGEGDEMGRRTYFVRVAGCSAKCPGCDTPYALDPKDGYLLDAPNLVLKLKKIGMYHVTLTGGEPLEQQNYYRFVDYLIKHAIGVTVETNGLVYQSRLQSPVHYVISPKPWMLTDRNRDSYFYWARVGATFKFVSGPKDVQRVRKWYKIFRLQQAWIQPWVETKKDKTVEGYVKLYKELSLEVIKQFNAGEDVRVVPQWHKIVFGFDKKGVEENLEEEIPKPKKPTKEDSDN